MQSAPCRSRLRLHGCSRLQSAACVLRRETGRRLPVHTGYCCRQPPPRGTSCAAPWRGAARRNGRAVHPWLQSILAVHPLDLCRPLLLRCILCRPLAAEARPRGASSAALPIRQGRYAPRRADTPAPRGVSIWLQTRGAGGALRAARRQPGRARARGAQNSALTLRPGWKEGTESGACVCVVQVGVAWVPGSDTVLALSLRGDISYMDAAR